MSNHEPEDGDSDPRAEATRVSPVTTDQSISPPARPLQALQQDAPASNQQTMQQNAPAMHTQQYADPYTIPYYQKPLHPHTDPFMGNVQNPHMDYTHYGKMPSPAYKPLPNFWQVNGTPYGGPPMMPPNFPWYMPHYPPYQQGVINQPSPQQVYMQTRQQTIKPKKPRHPQIREINPTPADETQSPLNYATPRATKAAGGEGHTSNVPDGGQEEDHPANSIQADNPLIYDEETNETKPDPIIPHRHPTGGGGDPPDGGDDDML